MTILWSPLKFSLWSEPNWRQQKEGQLAKSSVILFTFLCAIESFAQSPPFCDSGLACSSYQRDIENSFESNPKPPLIDSAIGVVFSGPCFYLMSGISPVDRHFGVAVFHRENAEIFYNGLFGFYHTQDPWAMKSAAELRQEFAEQGMIPKQLESNLNSLTASYLYPTSDLKYWFRSSDDEQSLFLEGRLAGEQGGAHYFCKMSRHSLKPIQRSKPTS